MIDEYDPLTDNLIERLRRRKVTHHQISDAGEPYETISWVHLVECIKLEAAAALEAKDAEIAVLLADAERMDWLKNNLMAYDFAEHAILIKWPKCVDFKFGDLRGSIDAARGKT